MLLSTIDTSTKRRTRKELSKFITSLQYLLNFAPSLGNLKYFSGQEIGHFIVHWSIAALKLFPENLSLNFGLITVFLEVALQIRKKSSALRFTPIHMFSKSGT